MTSALIRSWRAQERLMQPAEVLPRQRGPYRPIAPPPQDGCERQICFIERAWREVLCVFPAQPVCRGQNKESYLLALPLLHVANNDTCSGGTGLRRAARRCASMAKSKCGSSIVKMTMCGFPGARAMVKH